MNANGNGIGAWRSPVSALVWETRGRRFKSSRSDHQFRGHGSIPGRRGWRDSLSLEFVTIARALGADPLKILRDFLAGKEALRKPRES